jgi:hypothetical protein
VDGEEGYPGQEYVSPYLVVNLAIYEHDLRGFAMLRNWTNICLGR